jgi:hypothetical protein
MGAPSLVRYVQNDTLGEVCPVVSAHFTLFDEPIDGLALPETEPDPIIVNSRNIRGD